MRRELPKIELRKCSQMYKLLKEMVPHYTPEWRGSDENDPGVALLKIFSQMNENVTNRLNQAPKKNFVAFLDMLGIKLLPAQPARVPLTFKPAEGTEGEILVPGRTQAAAGKTTEHEELPFETEKDIMATPSQLETVISIDPPKDAIYVSPPGFLSGKQQGQNLITYMIVSSPSAGSKDFQLDHTTDLKAGDFLRIGDGEKEYVIISKISGMIVYITDRLVRDYSSNTPVEKITKFNLFEGKNMQEHGLYLGHSDLFNIKGTALFSLYVTHRSGTEVGVTPLKLSWEYWGEVKGEKGEDWQEFNITDGTQGLSKTGVVELTKVTEGEIKEKELTTDIKSRWIRCVVREPLGVNTSRKLPVLDNIAFIVRSSGENLLPDQAFNNDTPLDVTEPFTPFGKEPRMFDNFFIASKEVFSKKEAKIEMDVEVEPRGVLGGPVAISYDQKIKVFARGTYGRLIEVEIRPDETGRTWAWIDEHGCPPATRIVAGSTPAAVVYNQGGIPDVNATHSGEVEHLAATTYYSRAYISVFVRAENGHLFERFFNGMTWQWLDHGVPGEGVNVNSDPAVAYDKTSNSQPISVFVIGSDGRLYELNRDPDQVTGIWIDHRKPDDKIFDSSPYAVRFINRTGYNKVIQNIVFVKGQDGQLYNLNSDAGKNTKDGWQEYGFPDGVKVDSRPFAWIYNSSTSSTGYSIDGFVKGSDGAIWEFNVKNWEQSSGTPDKIKVGSDPHGYIETYSETSPPSSSVVKRIFVRGTDNCLWKWDGGWKSYQAPANAKLSFSPFVLKMDYNQNLHVFSASDQNSILEGIIPMYDTSGTAVWNEYKDSSETALTPVLSWEYWNNKGWVVLKVSRDETANLLKSGKIIFNLPDDIAETETAGQKSYWIRARIVGGDYGKETFALSESFEEQGSIQQLITTKNSIRPPIVNKLTISYAFETKQYPQQSWTYNNIEYLDQTEASKVEDKFFLPFIQLEDKYRTLYLGFEKSFKGGPICIFFAAKELSFTEEKKPKLEWTYSTKSDWRELKGSHDYTEGLIKRDTLELMGYPDFSAQSRFGNYLCWIKGSLTKGEYEESPLLDGIYPNTAWALQAETIKEEILGSSDGTANQEFSFRKSPILNGQEIRVCEILSEEEKQEIVASWGKDAIKEVTDEKGKVIETWALWIEVLDFFKSKPKDRHYTLDRALGKLQFGDGTNGMIPQIRDNNIKAVSYQSGGGRQGNVRAGEIKTLKSSVAGIDSVLNPVAADGGADTAMLDDMLEIGPAIISHRYRAVTAEDFEWLAKQASRKVIKVKCLPNTNNKGQKETGWVTLIIVPDSQEAKPIPSLELKNIVRKYLESHCANTLSCKKHINIGGPSYVEIGVSVDVFVTSIDKATRVEREVKEKLDAFFHPLIGRGGEGWDFGRDVSASDIYSLLEDIDGLDHVENLRFSSTGGTEVVEIKENFLVANGTHTINLQPIEEGGPYEFT